MRFSRPMAVLGLLTSCFAVPAFAQAPIIPGQQTSGPVIQSTGMSIKVDDPTSSCPRDMCSRRSS